MYVSGVLGQPPSLPTLPPASGSPPSRPSLSWGPSRVLPGSFRHQPVPERFRALWPNRGGRLPCIGAPMGAAALHVAAPPRPPREAGRLHRRGAGRRRPQHCPSSLSPCLPLIQTAVSFYPNSGGFLLKFSDSRLLSPSSYAEKSDFGTTLSQALIHFSLQRA